MQWRPMSILFVVLALSGASLYVLSAGIGPVPAVGTLLDPADGVYRTARHTAAPAPAEPLSIAPLSDTVNVLRDTRGVPHIFAKRDRDAIIALGYVTAQDRLFQMDFIPRAASGRLAEAFGPAAVSRDRFLRQTGMDWGARKNLERIRQERGLEWDILQWYTAGVNAYLDQLSPAELPFEFRLLGYTPDRYTPLQVLRVQQYMTYDLTYGTDDPRYTMLKERLTAEDFERLYPRHASRYVPIIPPAQQLTATAERPARDPVTPAMQAAFSVLTAHHAQREALRGTALEGYRPGKGSNNWAVAGARSSTGAPILAGDMHLGLNLPAIWYEAHLVTPTMNSYGVTIPGAPMLVEAYNEHVGWAFTNTGADQVDHLALEVDTARTRYRYDGDWRPLERVPDTIRVKGAAPVIDTLYYAHHGPVRFDRTANDGGAVALRWVAHRSNRNMAALWHMNRATTLSEFEDGLRLWDAPMQNILYAGTDGHIAIRSTGLLPIRRAGTGQGLLDGSTDRFEWVGRVPFDSLPHARDPDQGFLASSNQQPTGPGYPYYLKRDWGDAYRSLRIDTLLRRQATHSVDDLKRYQSDVQAMQRELFAPLLEPLPDLSPRADSLRRMLMRWDGATTVDRPEPLVLDVFLERLRQLAWDEDVFSGVPDPEDTPLLALLHDAPNSPWLDIQGTAARESADALLGRALEATADSLAARHGWNAAAWRWGDHHRVLFRHLTQSRALDALWRGPFEYPGFEATVSPARGRTATHSASWRMVVDFSASPPVGYGVYPGGQSGNPFHPRHYDGHLDTYLNFEHYRLRKPSHPGALPAEDIDRQVELVPAK